MSQSLMAEAEAAALAAQLERWPGEVEIQGTNYQCAVIVGRGASLMNDSGIYATEAITVIIPICQMETAPESGVMVENLATSRRYEIVSTRRDSAAWIIRGGIFP